MTQARGSQAVIGLFEESTYGTTPGSPAGTKLYVVKSTLNTTQPLISSATLDSTRARLRPGRGNHDTKGSIEVEISAENMGTLTKHALGSSTPTGTGPYTHTITQASSLPTGLEIEHDFGSNISGTGRTELFKGLRVGGYSFKFPESGICTATFEMVGATSTLGSTPIDASLTDNSHTPFSAFQATIQEGGASIATVVKAEIKGSNGLDAGNGYAIGANGVRRALAEGTVDITGTITAMFEDVTLLNKAVDDTSSSLKITLSRGDGLGSSGNESIEFLVQNLVYERTSAPVDGPGGVLITLPFMVYRSGSDNGLQITFKNAIATI